MKTASGSMQAHLLGGTTLSSMWLVKRTDGQIFAFTDHDVNIVFDLELWLSSGSPVSITPGPIIGGTGLQTYEAATSYRPSDVEGTSALNVADLELAGMLQSPSITEDDLRAGLWDYAAVVYFLVNWANLSMGAVILRLGHIGEVTVDRGFFRAETRGLTQAYTKTLGELTSPGCRADLGDSDCTVDLVGGSPSWTVTGTVESASSDGLVLYDSARTEPGPTGGISITGITNANPGHVTLASPVPFAAGEPVTLSGIVGMPTLNTVIQVSNPSGSGFDLSIDTTETAVYGSYISGGTATPLGGDTGYFDGGKITITSGPNAGIFREVKSYVPGQITLWIEFPYSLAAGSPAETYSMHVGCDKSLTTCRDRFNNVANHRGEWYLPGIDKLVQVGRHT